jgi:hypothetical protein
LGGTWFLATALIMDVESVPPDLVALTWVFVAVCMLSGAVFNAVIPRFWDRWLASS